ncbi:MAG: hypothetical protein AAF525_08040 [Pseudomonadota bacterium]
MKLMKKITALSAGLMLMSLAGQALAVTPANTLLQNQATLTYAGNPTGITADVTVTISLVKANVAIAPVFTPPADQTRAENQSFTATYTVFSQSNGPDTYTISNTNTTLNNVDGPVTFGYTPTTIDLGASALSAATPGATAVITVPSDGGAADNIVNDLEAGDTIVIANAEYTILTVVDAGGTGDATITLNANVPALPIGTGVYESMSFDVTSATVTTITNPLAVADITVETSISNGVDAPVTDDIVITVVQISIDKYVRCVSDCDDAGGTGAFAYDIVTNTEVLGVNYFSGGVTSEPGGVLEYLIVMTNPTGVNLTTALVSDVLPDFTTYTVNSTFLNGVAVTDDATETFPLHTGADDGGLRVGDGPAAGDTEGDGVITAGASVYVVYQIDVAN